CNYKAPNDCTVVLKNRSLWQKFNELETEMIITKTGRRMFPALQVQIADLDPHAYYCIFLEMTTVSHCRYKYSSSGGWAPSGPEEAQSPQCVYLHPESPATGEYWMSQAVSFGRLKLTNTPAPPVGHVVLSSMHKYQPRIVIAKTSDPRVIDFVPRMNVVFPETQFIAVTAYQNEEITKLKIDNNPFAKGFRENGQSKCKRKRVSEDKNVEVKTEVKTIGSPTSTSQDSTVTTSNSSAQSSPAPLRECETNSVKLTECNPVPYIYNSVLPSSMAYLCPPPAVVYPYYYCSPYPAPETFWNRELNLYYQRNFFPHHEVTEPPQKKARFTDFSVKSIMGCT
ncbi:hypothetical protein NQ315_010673, partial [Exocentrus adspersus]